MISVLFIFLNLVNYITAFNINTCDHSNEKKCIDNWACMWCNKTNMSTSSCYKSPICDFDESIYTSCNYKDKKIYNMVCGVSNVLFLVLLIMGSYVSMIVIYGTVDRLLLNEGVSAKTRRSVNTVLIILTFTPLVLTFVFKPIYFYFMFFIYLVCGIFTACCVRIKKTPETECIINNPVTNPPIK